MVGTAYLRGAEDLLLPLLAIRGHNAERFLATDSGRLLRMPTLPEIKWALPNQHFLSTEANAGFRMAVGDRAGRENRHFHHCKVMREDV